MYELLFFGLIPFVHWNTFEKIRKNDKNCCTDLLKVILDNTLLKLHNYDFIVIIYRVYKQRSNLW
jgi:hypothetical protein